MEQYEVKITEPAQRQLQEIIRYIAGDLQEKRTAIRMLDTLEKEPAENWSSVKKAIVTALVSVLVGGVGGALLALIVK